MAVKSLINFQPLADSQESPAKKPRLMNTPPHETDESDETKTPLDRLVEAKAGGMSGNEAALTVSWERLLRQIHEEVIVITQTASNMVPVIDFEDIGYEPPSATVPLSFSLVFAKSQLG